MTPWNRAAKELQGIGMTKEEILRSLEEFKTKYSEGKIEHEDVFSEENVRGVLVELGMLVTSKGYKYWVYTISKYGKEEKKPNVDIIYEDVAEHFDVTATYAMRNMLDAVRDTYIWDDVSFCYELFGYDPRTPRRGLNNKSFLKLIAEHIKERD